MERIGNKYEIVLSLRIWLYGSAAVWMGQKDRTMNNSEDAKKGKFILIFFNFTFVTVVQVLAEINPFIIFIILYFITD